MTASQGDSTSTTVTPIGQAAALVALAITFSVLASVVVCLRVYVRVTIRRFGADDWLMCIGWVLALLHNAFLIWGGFFGLGMVDSYLTERQIREGEKAVFAWVISWGVAITFVKTSICVALLRIAEQKTYRIILWIMIGITVIIDSVEVLATAFGCQPISDSWDLPPGSTCGSDIDAASFEIMIYAEFAVYITVDIACVVLPILIVWNLRMKTSLKISTAGMLGLGALATIATMVRLPLTLKFNNEVDRLWYRGRTIIWAMIELNVGIIAGSAAPLQKLSGLLSGSREISSGAGGRRSAPLASPYPRINHNQVALVTIGQKVLGRRNQDEELSLGDFLQECASQPENDRLPADDESTRRMIKTRNTEETSTEIGRGSVIASNTTNNEK